jgi:glutamate synthase domain-containing protein 2
MNAILITLNIIVLSTLGALAIEWPPALFAFLFVGPLSIISIWGISKGGLSARMIFVSTAAISLAGIVGASYFSPAAYYGLLVVGPFVLLGFADMLQSKRAIRRNFPVIGHIRYLLEEIRPEIQQYFIESNTDGKPFPREDRDIVYQRSKGERSTLPFGTQRDVYATGYEWINHSLAPVEPDEIDPRIWIGKETCSQPYHASILNISAMSFGSLSGKAIESLNIGAREGGFAHNTGEGSISSHHLQGGDLIWQIGTGYFGCRAEDGGFDPDLFVTNAMRPEVKMIEVKLSQGAKPGHGGILPAAKITPEIAEIRGVPLGQDVISPAGHRAFSTPVGLLEFVAKLRDLSGGKPVGFKLCVGKRREFLAVCKAMIETGLHPDYIAVDGGEGGTGAAPAEFSNSLGCPLVEGLTFVHNSLVGVGLRDRVVVIASGKVASGFDLVRRLALGADACYSARSMMMSMGCIQARKCNSNECPVGIATQNPSLTAGLVVETKSTRVARYHDETIHAALEMMGAAGLDSPRALRPWHILRRVSPLEVRHYGEIVDYLEPNQLLGEAVPEEFARAWTAATAASFQHVNDRATRVSAAG